MPRWLFAGLLLVVARVVPAQTIETPAPFDSAARLFVITPGVATRLGLVAPAWPVGGEYIDARLYSVSPTGGFVLVARTPSGVFQRFSLSPAERASLQAAIDAAVVASGRPGADVGSDVSEPAGNGFARHLTVLGALAYGPLAASLADDGHAVRLGRYSQVKRVAARGLLTFGNFGTEYAVIVGMAGKRSENLLASDEPAALDRFCLGAERNAARRGCAAFREWLRIDRAVLDNALVVDGAPALVFGAGGGVHLEIVGQRTGPQRRADVHVPG